MSGYSIKDLADALAAEAVGDVSLTVSGVSEPKGATPEQLAVAMDPRYAGELADGNARAAIIWRGADWQKLGLSAAILVERPRLAMAGITRIFLKPDCSDPGIHPTAIIDPTARIGDGASIGAFVVIGVGVMIGTDAKIGSHVSVGRDTKIGNAAVLQAGVKIGADVRIGDRFFAHPGVVVGADGFSFVTAEPSAMEKARETLGDTSGSLADQDWLKIHSIGGVDVGHDVEIGSNSSVDAGTIRPTRIGNGCKIDALVQVGHNVIIGANCLLCAHVAVGGSASLGNNVVLGGQVGVADNITIGDNVVAGGASKILSNVPGGRAILGYPAMKMETHVESYKALRRLPRLFRDVAKIQESISNSGKND